MLPPIGNSDHSTLLLKLNIKCRNKSVFKKIIWKYNKCNQTLLNSNIRNTDWEHILSINDPERMTDTFIQTLFAIYKNNIPNKVVTCKSSDKSWFRENIRTEINKRNRFYRLFKRTKLHRYYDLYRAQMNLVTDLIQNAKQNHEDKLLNSLDSTSKNKKDYWVVIKKLLKNKFVSETPTLVDPESGLLCDSDISKSNLFLKVLLKKCHLDASNNDVLPPFPDRCQHNFIFRHANLGDILKIINNLVSEKACGVDDITNKMLKLSIHSISPLLTVLFNNLIDRNIFPNTWKLGIVTTIYKKGDKSDPNNYRPITLLNTISKIFERVLYNSMYSHLIENSLIYHLQSGFLSGHSTADQLLAICTDIFRNFEENKDVRSVFLDLSAAFDTVPHSKLLHKIKSYGIKGGAYHMIQSYLSNRKIKVRENGIFSNISAPNYINSSVPQGSILGPLLFLLYINDLPDNLQCTTYLYADDTSINLPVDPNNPDPSHLVIQRDLNKITTWAASWGMNFKPSKSCELVFTKRGVKNYLPLYLDNVLIPSKTNHKHLGFILDSNLNFTDHITNLGEKIQKLINPLKPLSRKLKSTHLNTIYSSFIFPHYDYCDILYSERHQVPPRQT